MGNLKSDQKNTRKYGIKLSKSTDADIIAKLDSQPSIQGYIKSLIRADMKGDTAMNKYLVNEDSFGDNCPKNWEEIANFLNPIIRDEIEALGDDAEYYEQYEVSCKIWDRFCEGEIEGCPDPIFND